MPKVRTFIAVEVPPAVKEAMAEAASQMAFTGRAVRWVRPSGIHLTLKFLGDVEAQCIDAVVASTREAAGKGAGPFELRTGEIGGFPDLSRARVLWMGLVGDLVPLSRLQSEVGAQMAGLGFAPETRPFTPHLTLGRARRRPIRAPLDSIPTIEPVAFPVDRIRVIKSDLRPEGAVYTPLGEVLLNP